MESSKPQLSGLVSALGKDPRVLKFQELQVLIRKLKTDKVLPKSNSTKTLIDQLLASEQLRKIILTTEDYGSISRFAWNSPSIHQVALSIREGAYLSHATAVALHGLNEQIPRIVYVNKEQSIKAASVGKLAQDAVDRAFSNRQRSSKLIYHHGNYRIVILSGKNTGALGVMELSEGGGPVVQVTSIERTLIDIAVRPSYGGGVYQVLEAYRGAKNRVSVPNLLTMLRDISYSYPYHQVIGFYLELAGYGVKDLALFKRIPKKIDFYLDYGIPESQRSFNKEWKLFFPKGL